MKFIIYCDNKGEWRWSLRARNNENLTLNTDEWIDAVEDHIQCATIERASNVGGKEGDAKLHIQNQLMSNAGANVQPAVPAQEKNQGIKEEPSDSVKARGQNDPRLVPFHEAALDKREHVKLIDGHIYKLSDDRRIEVWRVSDDADLLCVRIFRPTTDGKTSKLLFGLQTDSALCLASGIHKALVEKHEEK